LAAAEVSHDRLYSSIRYAAAAMKFVGTACDRSSRAFKN
jgi:hypothetical protein